MLEPYFVSIHSLEVEIFRWISKNFSQTSAITILSVGNMKICTKFHCHPLIQYLLGYFTLDQSCGETDGQTDRPNNWPANIVITRVQNPQSWPKNCRIRPYSSTSFLASLNKTADLYLLTDKRMTLWATENKRIFFRPLQSQLEKCDPERPRIKNSSQVHFTWWK